MYKYSVCKIYQIPVKTLWRWKQRMTRPATKSTDPPDNQLPTQGLENRDRDAGLNLVGENLQILGSLESTSVAHGTTRGSFSDGYKKWKNDVTVPVSINHF